MNFLHISSVDLVPGDAAVLRRTDDHADRAWLNAWTGERWKNCAVGEFVQLHDGSLVLRIGQDRT